MIEQQLQHKINTKTKPVGSLGMLEQLALQIGGIQQSLTPTITNPTIVIFAADHGIANEGVSAYPQAVTYQMVMNFLGGGAAINVFAKQHNIDLKIVDAGVNFDFGNHDNLLNYKVGKGTKSFLNEQAMSFNDMQLSLQNGATIVQHIFATGTNTIGFGEMGIGNTSAATMLMSTILKLPIEKCVGKGTGLNEVQLNHKIELLKRAKANHQNIDSIETILQTFGGFEIAQMCGAMLEAYKKNMVILIDGFIASAAFLVAHTMNNAIEANAIFCHLSDEYGHQNLLNYFNAKPILKLGMRLGEGTGCAVALPIIQSAVAFVREMASFEEAGVSTAP